ncbi:LmeA family phospholipid-binding protein [Streptomyces sp. NBC_00455]|uniref:LmeA family phospholipid-binding protein n=1 Tax=Streptomyces sp. NBC_00455 TaxID=2903654 RepID=UPI002E1A38DD
MTFSGGLVSVLRSRRRTVAAGAVAPALAALAATADSLVRGRIATVAGERPGTAPDVGVGATPALWQLARGAFTDVELTADGVSVRHLTGLGIDAHLRQLRRSGKDCTVGSSSVTVDIGTASLAGADESRPNSVVAPDPAHGRLVVHIGPAGAVAVPVTPVLAGRTIHVTAGRATFAGSPLPDALAERITRTAGLTDLPLELQPRRLTVTDNSLRLALSGGHAAFRT